MTTPTPRADAARPVLHFTGRADMLNAMKAWSDRGTLCAACDDPSGDAEARQRLRSFLYTVNTGDAP